MPKDRVYRMLSVAGAETKRAEGAYARLCPATELGVGIRPVEHLLGDGKRVRSIVSGVTTDFVGNYYEVASGVVTKYYYAGGQRIAMRADGDLFFLIGDHLGSTSLTTDASGAIVSELRYKAWGEERYASGSTPTDYTYTGQYSYTADFGLMYYNARWYDPSLGRFAQADTIVPSVGTAKAWDRYAYANNSPLKYTDPSGHDPWWLQDFTGSGPNNQANVAAYYNNSGGRDYSSAKTLKDFEDLSWYERKQWLIQFSQKPNLEGWFDDMIGAVDFMANDPHLSKEGGTAEVMDAAVLQALNDGWLLFTGNNPSGAGGAAWAVFFEALTNKISSDPNSLIVTRLKAEQFGVDYAWGLAGTQSAYNNSSDLDQIYFDIFKGGADSYRSTASSFRSNPLAVSGAENTVFLGPSLLIPATDPRTSGPYLTSIGRFGYPAAFLVWSFANSSPPSRIP